MPGFGGEEENFRRIYSYRKSLRELRTRHWQTPQDQTWSSMTGDWDHQAE